MKSLLIINLFAVVFSSPCMGETDTGNSHIFRDVKDVEAMLQDGKIGFYGLNLSDDYETALAKLESSVPNTMSGEDIVDGMFNIFPEDQNLQERDNLDYLASYYNGTFYAFSKFAIQGSDFAELKAYFIENGIGEKHGNFVYHKITKKGFLYSLSTNQKEGILSIVDLSRREIVVNEYRKLE